MTFIETVPENEATGPVAEMYEFDRRRFGHVPNFTRAFSTRPAAYAAWLKLMAAIKKEMDLRRFELATVAAARRLRSSYCTLAHGSVLLDEFMAPEEVRAVVDDYHRATLEPVEVAIMDLADKVAQDATTVAEEDINRLREFGLSDGEIADVVLAASARCFFSKTLDALGAEPDAKYVQLDPGVRDALTVGRPIPAV
jgi:uncharacterized peroxidase-related enzyme